MEFQIAVKDTRAALKRLVRPIPDAFSNFEAIGAVCESSRWLAHRMVKAIGVNTLPVVELGAGYGSITRILPLSAVSIEREDKRLQFLKDAFPERQIIDDCAIAYLDGLQEPTVVVSCIPSVNNSEFGKLQDCVRKGFKAGTIAKLITYTYLPHNPFAGIFPKSEIAGIEVLNIPPAIVWRYSC